MAGARNDDVHLELINNITSMFEDLESKHSETRKILGYLCLWIGQQFGRELPSQITQLLNINAQGQGQNQRKRRCHDPLSGSGSSPSAEETSPTTLELEDIKMEEEEYPGYDFYDQVQEELEDEESVYVQGEDSPTAPRSSRSRIQILEVDDDGPESDGAEDVDGDSNSKDVDPDYFPGGTGAIPIPSPSGTSSHTPDGRKAKLFTCLYCPERTFKDRSGWLRHHWTHTGEMPYKCNFPGCELGFRHPSAKKQHYYRVHELGQVPIVRKKQRLGSLPTPRRRGPNTSSTGTTRSQVANYPCPHCAKKFLAASTLQCHIYTHTGEKPFICHFCDKAYNCPSNLRRHIRQFCHKAKKKDPDPGSSSSRVGNTDTQCPGPGAGAGDFENTE